MSLQVGTQEPASAPPCPHIQTITRSKHFLPKKTLIPLTFFQGHLPRLSVAAGVFLSLSPQTSLPTQEVSLALPALQPGRDSGKAARSCPSPPPSPRVPPRMPSSIPTALRTPSTAPPPHEMPHKQDPSHPSHHASLGQRAQDTQLYFTLSFTYIVLILWTNSVVSFHVLQIFLLILALKTERVCPRHYPARSPQVTPELFLTLWPPLGETLLL